MALAIIVAHATEGSFVGWAGSLRGYGLALLLAAGLYPGAAAAGEEGAPRLSALLAGPPLDRAIAEQRNAVVGAVEGVSYLATALLVTGLL